MTLLRCKQCGNLVDVPYNRTVLECPSCGTMTTFPVMNLAEKERLYNFAEELRFQGEFVKSASAYMDLVKLDKTDADIWWGLGLAIFFVKYVEEALLHQWHPICVQKADELWIFLQNGSDRRIFSIATSDAIRYAKDDLQKEIYAREILRIEDAHIKWLGQCSGVSKGGASEMSFTINVEDNRLRNLLVRQLDRLRARDWGNALNSASQMLNANYENGYAHLFHFMAEKQIACPEDIAILKEKVNSGDTNAVCKTKNLAEEPDIQNAWKYGDRELQIWILGQFFENRFLICEERIREMEELLKNGNHNWRQRVIQERVGKVEEDNRTQYMTVSGYQKEIKQKKLQYQEAYTRAIDSALSCRDALNTVSTSAGRLSWMGGLLTGLPAVFLLIFFSARYVIDGMPLTSKLYGGILLLFLFIFLAYLIIYTSSLFRNRVKLLGERKTRSHRL